MQPPTDYSIMVSVFMLTYNHEKYIGKAIESVVSQETNFIYELIIGEDCSLDNTRQIVQKYQQQYPNIVKPIFNEHNIGVSKNAQNVRDSCNGKYIAFLDGDDYWSDKHKLQKQVDFLESNPDYGMVHTDVDILDQEKNLITKNVNKSRKINFPSGNILTDYLKNENLFIKPVTAVIRNSIFKRAANYTLIKEKGWVLEDLPIYLEIAANTKIKYLDCSTAVYRLLNESSSRTRNKQKQHNFHLSVYDIRYYFWEKYSKDEIVKKSIDRKYVSMLMGDAYKMNDIKQSKYSLQKHKELGQYPSLKSLIKLSIIFTKHLSKKRVFTLTKKIR